MSIWPDQSGNKLNQTYIRGFLDISGGDINIRNNGNIFVGNNTSMNGNLIVGNNAILNKNVTIGQSIIPYLLYDFETIDICSNINNVIQCIPAPNLFQGNTNNLISNQKDSLAFKNGLYDISASSFIGTNYVYNAFNGSNGNIFWQSNPNYNNGVYIGNTVTNYANNLTLSGEWIQIKFPNTPPNTMAMILTKYSFVCNTNNTTKGPKNHSIFGSNTGNSWTLIANNPMNLLNTPYSTKATIFNITNTQPYYYYRLVINSIWPGPSVNAAIQQWNLYGIPYTNNSAISTSLLYNYSSSLYDSLFSSSSSTMIDSTNNITGNSSLKLDGIKNSIVIPYLPVTDKGLTFSVWIQPNFSPSISNLYYTIFEFLNAINSISIILNTSNGNISWQVINQTSFIIPNISITPFVWTHIAWTITYDSGNNSVWQFYLNGVNVYSLTSQKYPTPGDFFINYIGRSTYSITNSANYQEFYGNIDNFRAYNTVLTPFQIGSLYNIRELLTINNSLYYQYNDTFLGNKLSVLGDTSLNNNVTIYGTTTSTSSTTGALIVSGGVGIRGNLNIASSTPSISSTTGAFVVSGGIGMGGNLNIASSTPSTSSTTGALTVQGGIGLGGNLNIGSTTNSNSTTTGSLVVSGGVGIANNTNIGGNVKISTNTITTDLSSGSFINGGGAAISGNVHIGSNATIYATTPSTSSTTGALTISGGIGMGGNLYVGSNTNSDSTTNGSLVVSGGVGIANNTNIGGNVKITTNTITTDLSSGSFINGGGAAISGNVHIGSNTTIYATTPSISTTTGALTISGGIGIGGNLYVGSTTNSSSTTTGSLVVSGGVGIANNTNIGGNVKITTNTISTDLNTGSFITGGGAAISGNIHIGSNATIYATTPSTSNTTGALVIYGGVGIGGNINIGGSINSSGVSSPQFNSINNILITSNTPNYYLLGRLSGKTFQIIIISGAVDRTINTIAETCTISGIIFSDGTITASYYTNGQNLVIDNIYVNRVGSTSNYDVYIHTNTNYSIQSAFNIYNINGTWTVNPTINTSISSPPTGTWTTLNNFLQITSNAISTTTTNGAFIVTGGAGIGGNVNIGSALNVTGGATIGTNIVISGTTESTSTNTGTLTVSGGMGVAGNTNIGGNTIIYATTPSTSKTTGALTISGGLGMGGNLYVGSTANSTSTSNGSLVVLGGAGIAGNTNIGGNITTNGSILVSGNAGITGNINIGGNGIIYGLMNCSGGLITPSYKITSNLVLSPTARLHNSYILFSSTVTADINQYLPEIQNKTSSSIYLNNISTVDQTIYCSSPNVFYGSGFESNNLVLPIGYSVKFISDGSNWFVDTYKYNGSRLVDTNTNQEIYGNNTFYGTTYFNIISTNKITDNGLITDVNTLNAKTSIIANGTLSAIGITDTGTQTTINRLSATSIVNSGTFTTSGITDISNTIIGTSTINTLLVNSLTKINGGISNKVFNLNSPIAATSALYGATIHFLLSISTGNINQRIPTAAITGGYNTTIFFVNYSTTTQIIFSDGGNFYGQQISTGGNPNIALLSNYCFTLRSDGTNWSVQNTQHITNLPIDNTATQTIGGLKTFSSVLNINGGIYYKNISVTANNTVGNATWYGSTIDISNSTTWVTTLPTAENNTNMYIWNHSAVNQTINALSGDGFFGYNITNNSTSVSIPAYSMIAIRSTSTYTTKTWYVQPYIREGSFFMDNYSDQSFSGTKTFTGSSNFGTTLTDQTIFNSNVYLKGGIYSDYLLYNAPTTMQKNVYGSTIILDFFSIGQTQTMINALITNTVSYCVNIMNRSSFSVRLVATSGNTFNGQGVSPLSIATSMTLLPNTYYSFVSVGSVWNCINISTYGISNVNDTADQTIGGTKTFSTAITTPGIITPNTGNLKKIVLFNSSSDLNQFTSFYGFGIGASILSYNVDSLNSNHIFYCANDTNSAANGYIELLKIGNAGIFASKDLTINTGNKIITPAITLNGYDLGTTIAALTGNVGGLPTLSGTNNWLGPNTFTQTVTALAFNVTSDYRIKDDVNSLHVRPDEFTVDKLRPVTYYNNQTKKHDIGLIAHELQEEYPFLVNGEKDGENYQSVNYIGIIGILIKEIQELKSRIALLEK